MAKDKKKKPSRMGFDKEEAAEELVADALKRTDMYIHYR